jgi:hypothetical protein
MLMNQVEHLGVHPFRKAHTSNLFKRAWWSRDIHWQEFATAKHCDESKTPPLAGLKRTLPFISSQL